MTETLLAGYTYFDRYCRYPRQKITKIHTSELSTILFTLQVHIFFAYNLYIIIQNFVWWLAMLQVYSIEITRNLIPSFSEKAPEVQGRGYYSAVRHFVFIFFCRWHFRFCKFTSEIIWITFIFDRWHRSSAVVHLSNMKVKRRNWLRNPHPWPAIWPLPRFCKRRFRSLSRSALDKTAMIAVDWHKRQSDKLVTAPRGPLLIGVDMRQPGNVKFAHILYMNCFLFYR